MCPSTYVVHNAKRKAQITQYMTVNLECQDCHFIFNADVGSLEMDKIGTLIYEKKPTCPKCKAYDKVFITPLGLQQLDKWFMNYLNTKIGK